MRAALWPFSQVWGIYPHRDGTVPADRQGARSVRTNTIRRHRWDAALLPNGAMPSVTTLRGVLFMSGRFDKTFSLIPCPPFVSTKLDFTKTCHKKVLLSEQVSCNRKPIPSFLCQRTRHLLTLPQKALEHVIGHLVVVDPSSTSTWLMLPVRRAPSRPWRDPVPGARRKNRSDRRPRPGAAAA